MVVKATYAVERVAILVSPASYVWMSKVVWIQVAVLPVLSLDSETNKGV